MKAVRCRQLLARVICQNLQLVSSFLNTLAPENCVKVSLTLGRGCTSRNTHSLKGLKSTHMCTDPTTMPAHHGVGVSTRKMTPSDSIWNFVVQRDTDIAGSEQCKGLGN